MYAAPTPATRVHARMSFNESEIAAAIRIAATSTTIAQNSVVNGAHFDSSWTAIVRSATSSIRSPIAKLLSSPAELGGPLVPRLEASKPSPADPLGERGPNGTS